MVLVHKHHKQEFPLMWVAKFSLPEDGQAFKLILSSLGISLNLSAVIMDNLSEIEEDDIAILLKAVGDHTEFCRWVMLQPSESRLWIKGLLLDSSTKNKTEQAVL